MSGLLGGVLPTIFSQADRAKRYLGGLLSDPIGRLEQAGGQAKDDLTKIGLLSEQAFNDPKNPMKLQDNAAARQLVDTYLNSVLNFAPVGMFVGPKSATWDKAASERAQALAQKGVDPRQIWKETGTFKGPDGMWRQEIDDSAARAIDAAQWGWGNRTGIKQGEAAIGPIDEFLQHEQLSRAYPNGLMNFGGSENRAVMSVSPKQSESASFMSGVGPDDWGRFGVGMEGNAINKKSALHELQHAIQEKEGFAIGGDMSSATAYARGFKNMDEFSAAKKSAEDAYWASRKAVDQAMSAPRYKGQAADIRKFQEAERGAQQTMKQFQTGNTAEAMDAYRRLGGEAEARATEARMNMNMQQRREVFPLDSYDVPLDQLILRR